MYKRQVRDVDDAVAQVRRVESVSEIVELVCRNPADVRSVRKRVDVPIAVDLTVLAADPECADVAVLRCGELGGVRRALRRFEKLGLPCLLYTSDAADDVIDV